MSDDPKARRAAAGASNLAKWKAEHPAGGNFRHGAFSRHFAKRCSDARTTAGRALRDVMRELEADLGTISAGQRIILGRIREKLIVLSAIGGHIDKQKSVLTEGGELLPCLRWGYTTYSEALRRDLELVYTLAHKRPSKAPSLEDYLKQRGAKP